MFDQPPDNATGDLKRTLERIERRVRERAAKKTASPAGDPRRLTRAPPTPTR